MLERTTTVLLLLLQPFYDPLSKTNKEWTDNVLKWHQREINDAVRLGVDSDDRTKLDTQIQTPSTVRGKQKKLHREHHKEKRGQHTRHGSCKVLFSK